jgi:hypothetical protein
MLGSFTLVRGSLVESAVEIVLILSWDSVRVAVIL